MRKTFSVSLFFLSLFFLFFLLIKPSYAVCSIGVNPPLLNPDYNNNVIITGSKDCNFETEKTYTVFAYPSKKGVSPGQYANYGGAVSRVKPTNPQTITAKINLFEGAIGKDNLGLWDIKVCAIVSPLKECGISGNILAQSSISATASGSLFPSYGNLYQNDQPEAPRPPPPCAQWGGWNRTQYVPLTDDQAKNYFDENGQLRPGNADIVKCISVDTAIGQISTEPQAFVRSIFNLVLGLAGGIALILIIISGYKFMASSGNPEATKAATEQLTSAIIGLLFIIFAFVILEMIGVDILKIPGFKP